MAVVAFEGYDRHTMQPAYAWTSQLMAGYMPQQICGFAEKAISEALAASPGTKAEVGGNSETSAWVRIYPQMKDLIKQLQVHGFDVWIVSASNQYIIEAFSPRVGINPDHVIGVRQMLDAKGMITYNLRGCGPVADGENSLITYKTGKRCWINSEIFGVSPDKAMVKHEDPRKPQLFAAGDSDTDMPFVADASGLHLVINRNKPELMCHALNNADGKWLINPMFIDPLPKRETPYPCSSRACVTPGGALEPCRDQDGSILNDKYE